MEYISVILTWSRLALQCFHGQCYIYVILTWPQHLRCLTMLTWVQHLYNYDIYITSLLVQLHLMRQQYLCDLNLHNCNTCMFRILLHKDLHSYLRLIYRCLLHGKSNLKSSIILLQRAEQVDNYSTFVSLFMKLQCGCDDSSYMEAVCTKVFVLKTISIVLVKNFRKKEICGNFLKHWIHISTAEAMSFARKLSWCWHCKVLLKINWNLKGYFIFLQICNAFLISVEKYPA